jgi:hypothetical protein
VEEKHICNLQQRESCIIGASAIVSEIFVSVKCTGSLYVIHFIVDNDILSRFSEKEKDGVHHRPEQEAEIENNMRSWIIRTISSTKLKLGQGDHAQLCCHEPGRRQQNLSYCLFTVAISTYVMLHQQ